MWGWGGGGGVVTSARLPVRPQSILLLVYFGRGCHCGAGGVRADSFLACLIVGHTAALLHRTRRVDDSRSESHRRGIGQADLHSCASVNASEPTDVPSHFLNIASVQS